MSTGILLERDVRTPMRDGVELVADVWRPSGGDPVPALLQRTPYNKAMAPNPELARFASAGYAVVVQDVRGRYASDGEFVPFVNEAVDGLDTIAWVAAQGWCDGQVGTIGSSYVGATQWLPAVHGPEALRAMAPTITTDEYYEGWTYQGGAFQLGFVLTWTLMFLGLGEVARRLGRGEARLADLNALVDAADDLDALFKHLPLTTMPHGDAVGSAWADWLAHPSYDDFWRTTAPRERPDGVTVATLNIGGWYDLFIAGTLANYSRMRDDGATPQARGARLVVGPWAHANMTGTFPERMYGLRGGALLADLTGEQLRWFNHHLRGEGELDDDHPVRLFVLGVDAWLDEADWPPPDMTPTDLHLRAGGALTEAAPDAGEAPQEYRYDPADPVPTLGGATFLPGLTIGANAGPRDQRAMVDRADVLTFETDPLAGDLTVIGPVELVLWAASSARDTDFTAKLVDVHPDGRADLLCDGILRARYRTSLSAPEPLEPGRPYELRVAVGPTANVFRAGHRVRLDVSSSNFPRFDRNTNSGGDIASETEHDFVVATNTVFHDAQRRSRLTLPTVKRDWPPK